MKLKSSIVLFLYLAFGSFGSSAQAPPVFDWQKCLGGTAVDIANKIIHSNDGGYIIAGSTTSNNRDITFNNGVRDIWIVKLNSAGVLEWQRSLGGSGSEFASAVIQLPNNKIIIAGYTSSTNGNVTLNHGSLDEWLICLDGSGNLIWQKTYGGSAVDMCLSLDLCPDGGFILGGSSASVNGNVTGNHGDKDFWIVKTDSVGNLQWQKSLGGTRADECYKIIALSGGGYLAAGYTDSDDGQVSGSHGNYDYWIVKLDNVGTIEWQKCAGGSSNEVATSALENSSGNFMVGGYSNSNNGDITASRGSSDYWLIRIDSANGNILSQHSYGGSNSDIAYDLIPTVDGGYMLTGGSTSRDVDVTGNHSGEDFWLTKTDAAGNIVWARSYGGSGNDRPSSIIQNTDGGFSVTGYTYSNNGDVSGNHGSSDVWILKLSCFIPVANFITSSDVICVNSSLNFTNTSEHSAQYRWFVDDVSFSVNTNSNFQFHSSGIHKVSLVGYTCYETDTLDMFISVFDFPVPVITADSAYFCEGNSATLSVNAADSYQWNVGDTSSSITVNAGGNYSVTVTTNGCSATTSYSISRYSNPMIELGNDTAICAGSSITLHASPGYQTYEWQDGSTDSVFTTNANGVYSVAVSNGFCNSSDAIQVSITANPVPSITSNSPYVCEGGSAILSTPAADSYIWNNGGTSSSIQIDSGGVYSVTVTTDGCSGSTSLNVDQHSSPSIDLGNDTTICSGFSITLYVPSGYQSYVWQDGSTDSMFNASAIGIYFVTVDNGFCSSTDSIQVSMTPCALLTANFFASQTSICQGTCVDFTDQSQNAVSWDWDFTGAATPASNSQSPLGICYNTPGNYSVSLVIHGSNGSTNAMMRTNYIVVNAPPAMPSITANGTFLTSTYSDSYQWLLHSAPIAGATIQTYNVTQAGYYSVMVTDANGCSATSDSMFIGITGIEMPVAQNDIYVYPNPGKGMFYLFFIKGNATPTEVEVTDITGKTIYQSVIESAEKLSIESINLEQFSNGVYFLHLKADSKVLNKKLVLQR